MQRLYLENTQQTSRLTKEESDKKLAVLTPQQRAQLRTEMLDKDDPSGEWGIKIKGERGLFWIYTLLPYADFGKEEIQKELSLTAAQRAKVREILGKSSSLWEKYAEDLATVPHAEREKLRGPNGGTSIASAAGFMLGKTPQTRWKELPEHEKKIAAQRQERLRGLRSRTGGKENRHHSTKAI